jgi:signal transduction histidine kinase
LPNSEERLRISREIHDGLAQDLAAIGYALDGIIGKSALDQPSRTSLRELRTEVSQLVTRVRDEIFTLRSPRIEDLTVALRESLEKIFSGSHFHYEVNGTLQSDIGEEIVKVITELARNTKTYSDGNFFSVHIEDGLIRISDNGSGGLDFSSERFGLTGVRERLTIIRHTLRYESASNTIIIEKLCE